MSMSRDEGVIVAQPLDERVEYTLVEVVSLCGVSEEHVVELVTEGIADPLGGSPAEWRITGPDVARILTAVRLQHDLGLNRAGAALALELLERLSELRRRLRQLEPE
jgi:chaperone modulatory protein CbpM